MRFRILHYDTLDSTNHLARSFAEEGAGEGTVITAEYQTRGRGRFKKRWVSPRGSGLLFSIILRPKLKTSSASILTHVAAKSVAEALQECFKISPKLKKPNDVLVHGKKIAGILTESSGAGQKLEYVIVGIGLNVNTQASKLPRGATSVACEIGKRTEKDEVLEKILSIFEKKYAEINSSGTNSPIPFDSDQETTVSFEMTSHPVRPQRIKPKEYDEK